MATTKKTTTKTATKTAGKTTTKTNEEKIEVTPVVEEAIVEKIVEKVIEKTIEEVKPVVSEPVIVEEKKTFTVEGDGKYSGSKKGDYSGYSPCNRIFYCYGVPCS